MKAAFEHKLSEVDRLLNDPDTPLDAGRIWSLLAEIARYEKAAGESGLCDGGLRE